MSTEIKTFDFFESSKLFNDFDSILESVENNKTLKTTLTEEEEREIDIAVDRFVKEYLEQNKTYEDFETDILNEGLIGSIVGGLAGFALGKTIGKIVARVLGVQKGILYDMLTSRLVGTALGIAIGKGR